METQHRKPIIAYNPFEDVYDVYFDFKDIIGIKKANRERNKKYGI